MPLQLHHVRLVSPPISPGSVFWSFVSALSCVSVVLTVLVLVLELVRDCEFVDGAGIPQATRDTRNHPMIRRKDTRVVFERYTCVECLLLDKPVHHMLEMFLYIHRTRWRLCCHSFLALGHRIEKTALHIPSVKGDGERSHFVGLSCLGRTRYIVSV